MGGGGIPEPLEPSPGYAPEQQFQYVYNKHNTTRKVLCTVRCGVYTLVVLNQKPYSFASFTCSTNTPRFVCKHRTHALSMKYSIFMTRSCHTDSVYSLVDWWRAITGEKQY